MPIINVKLVPGALRPDQKRELFLKLNAAVESVYPGLRDVTHITLEEVDAWAIGGQPVTAEAVAAHAEKNLKKMAG